CPALDNRAPPSARSRTPARRVRARPRNRAAPAASFRRRIPHKARRSPSSSLAVVCNTGTMPSYRSRRASSYRTEHARRRHNDRRRTTRARATTPPITAHGEFARAGACVRSAPVTPSSQTSGAALAQPRETARRALVSRLRGAFIPVDGGAHVAFDAAPALVHPAEHKRGLRVSLFRRALQPLSSLLLVANGGGTDRQQLTQT